MSPAALRRGMALPMILALSVLAPSALAGPAEAVYSPIVHWREWEFELKGGTQDWGNPGLGERAGKLAVAYGLMPRWLVEFEAEYSKTPGSPARIEEFEWENVFQLTEQGRYWADVGLFAELSRNRLERTNTLEAGPMFQKEWGRAQANLNLLFGREVGPSRDPAAPRHTGFEYVAQWKYRVDPRFQPGVQVFGSLGRLGHVHSETLRAGPALIGAVSLGGGRALKYDAAVLAGLTRQTPNATVRFRVEYEFY